jgi:type II secretion system protein H
MILRTGNNNPVRARAFTLIELLIVLALIGVMVAVSAPTLSHFIRGRTQDSEVKRFLALTRYGQSRAVSEGIPMMLWIDPKAGTYGLQQETGYTDGDKKAGDYEIGRDLKIDVVRSVVIGQQPAHTAKNLPAIRFLPDGGIDPTSVTGVTIQEGLDAPVLIGKSANGLSYELK